MDTVSTQNLLHLHGHFSWTALSITYRTSLGDWWSPALSTYSREGVLAAAVSTWAWLSQSSFLPKGWTHHAWSECRNQNHSRSPLWQLTAVGFKGSPKHSWEKEKGQSREIKLKPSHGAQQSQEALMRNPAKAGTSFPYPLCVIKAGVGSVSAQPSPALRGFFQWLCLLAWAQRSVGSSASPAFP